MATLLEEKRYLINLIKNSVSKGKFSTKVVNSEDFSLDSFVFLTDLGYTVSKDYGSKVITIDWSPQQQPKKAKNAKN